LITKVSDIRQVRQAHLSMFRDILQKQPKSWGKGPKDAEMSWDQVIARAGTLPADQVGLAISTINRHLDVFAQILARAEDDGIALDPKLNVKELRLRENKRSRDKRTGFPEADLNRLFQHTIWTGCKSGRLRNTSGRRIIKDGLYWVPLIAAYIGARREEISGLQPGCPIPDDHIDPRRSAFFMARSVLRECGGAENSPVDCFSAKRDGVQPC
jgi:hypothetical protein